jgi:hypothetical protein
VRVPSAAVVLGLACFALSGCGRAAYRSSVVATPSVPVAGREKPAASTCSTCGLPAQSKDKYPVSAFIACGPKLENHDEATGPLTLSRRNTVVYRSALTGRRVEVSGLCEVRFPPTKFAQTAR